METGKERLEAIFAEALELTSTAQREVYLTRVCAEDTALRPEVEALLEAYEKAGRFLVPENDPLEPGSVSEPELPTAMFPVTERAGDRIGRYRLLEKIGEGGCGVVYVAEQEEPVRRRVALKAIKLGMDTRSDIYSLGVLLYELLTGRTPFDANELIAQGIDAMRQTIRERQPVRPSTRVAGLKGEELTTTAKQRSAEAPKLITLLKGDLDWIAMKCLEKDRRRRYETANGLALDIERHLKHEPVLARPPSTVYWVRKFARRNKLMVSAGGAVAVALVLGVVISTWQAIRATRAETKAEAALDEAPYPGVAWWPMNGGSVVPLGSPHVDPPPRLRFPPIPIAAYYPSQDGRWLVSWEGTNVYVTALEAAALGPRRWIGSHDRLVRSASLDARGDLVSSADEMELRKVSGLGASVGNADRGRARS